NAGPSSGGKFLMARHEVGVQVRFDNVANIQAVFPGLLQVNADVALRVDDGGNPLGSEHVGGVGKAAKVELLKVHFPSSYLDAKLLGGVKPFFDLRPVYDIPPGGDIFGPA